LLFLCSKLFRVAHTSARRVFKRKRFGAPEKFLSEARKCPQLISKIQRFPYLCRALLGIADHSISQYAEFNETHTFADANPLIGLVTVASDTLKLYDKGTLIGSMVATKETAGWTLPSLTNGAHNQCDASVATTFDVCLVLTDMCLPPSACC
jgi:hypothetical protein